jgi:hypothetical protein
MAEFKFVALLLSLFPQTSAQFLSPCVLHTLTSSSPSAFSHASQVRHKPLFSTANAFLHCPVVLAFVIHHGTMP